MPYSITIGRTKHSLSMNKLFNRQSFHLKRELKRAYKELVFPQVSSAYKHREVEILFVLYPPSKAKRDRSNFLSIHEKFLCDALVEFGVLVDDNDQFIKSTTYMSGPADKNDPRVEIYVSEISHPSK